MVNFPEDLIKGLMKLILAPEKITSFYEFSDLLGNISSEKFIAPLEKKILECKKAEEVCLLSYLYALGTILEKIETGHKFKGKFIELLGNWGINSNDELAYKSIFVLSQINNLRCYPYLRKVVRDTTKFIATRKAALAGLVNHQGLLESDLFESLTLDPDPEIRKDITSALRFLN